MAAEHRIDCLFPGLRASFEGCDFSDAPPLPNLSLLLAKGRWLPGSAEVFEARACALFGVQADVRGELPFAALSWLADTGARPDSALLRADPIHLRADQTQLRVFHAEQLGVEHAEAKALIDTLNRHFAADAVAFSAPVPQRWYARLSGVARMRTTALSAIVGQIIGDALPTGDDARLWRQRMNEVQMLLHDHPVNAARRERRQPPINSVWFWGGAALPEHLETDYSEVVSDNAVVAGLATLAGVPQGSGTDSGRPGHRLWSSEALAPWAAYGDCHTWLDRLARLDTGVFAALVQQLRESRRRVALLTGSGRDFVVRSPDLKRFWRRPRPPFDLLTGGPR